MGHACPVTVMSGHSLLISIVYEPEFTVPAVASRPTCRLRVSGPTASTVGRITPSTRLSGSSRG